MTTAPTPVTAPTDYSTRALAAQQAILAQMQANGASLSAILAQEKANGALLAQLLAALNAGAASIEKTLTTGVQVK